MIQDYLFINPEYRIYADQLPHINFNDFNLDKINVQTKVADLKVTLNDFQKIFYSEYPINDFYNSLQEFVYDSSNDIQHNLRGCWSIGDQYFIMNDMLLEYTDKKYIDKYPILIDHQYTNLSHVCQSEYTMILDIIDAGEFSHIMNYIIFEPQLQLISSFEAVEDTYHMTNTKEAQTLLSAVSKIYLHQNKSNSSEFMTITRNQHVFDKSYNNYVKFNHQAFVTLDTSHILSITKFYADAFKQGYDGRIVYINDDTAYYIDVHLKDNNLTVSDPSDQFVRLWTIDMNDFSNLTLADKLDADEDNGNNRFNTEVRDENWDESLQGRLSGPGISDYISYDSSNKFGLLSLGYSDPNSEDGHDIIQYFKKYTIDEDANTLSITNITVDWNGFNASFHEPDIFTTTDGPVERRLWSNTQFLHHFIKNGTHYFISIDYYIYDDSNYGKLLCKNVTRFRFFKLIDQDNLKMLDEYTAIYDNYTSPNGDTNQDDLSVFYLHKTHDNIFHLINPFQPFRRLIFNTSTESIDVKDFNYWIENDYVYSTGVKRHITNIFTPHYAIGKPYSKDEDSNQIEQESKYPFDYNIFNKYDIEFTFDQESYTVDYDNTTISVNVKVKDIIVDDYITAKVKLVLTDLGIFTDNSEKEIIVTATNTSGVDVTIRVNPTDNGYVNLIGYVHP